MTRAEVFEYFGITSDSFLVIDWTILAVVGLSMLYGLWRGLAREVMSLLGWVVAFVLANFLARSVAAALGSFVNDATLRYLVAWVLVFVGVLLMAGLLTSMVSRQLRQPGFNLGNRLLGAGFGVVRGVLVVVAFVWLLRSVLPAAERETLGDSALLPTIDAVAEWVDAVVGHWLDTPIVNEASDQVMSGEML